MSVGIENTKKFVQDLKVVVPKLIARAKDGVGVDDVLALGTDAEFRAAVSDLVATAKALPDEGKDLTLEEGAELVQPVTELVLAILREVKKPKAA